MYFVLKSYTEQEVSLPLSAPVLKFIITSWICQVYKDEEVRFLVVFMKIVIKGR